jgi:hypothetical protein
MIDYTKAAVRYQYGHGSKRHLDEAMEMREKFYRQKTIDEVLAKPPGPYARQVMLDIRRPEARDFQRTHNSKSFRQCARHEAAHWLMLTLDGAGVEGAYVVRREGRIEGGVIPRDRARMTRAAVVAGVVIDALDENRMPRVWDLKEGDRKHLRGGTTDAAIIAAMNLARGPIQRHAKVIDALADALVERGMIDGNEAERIFREAMGHITNKPAPSGLHIGATA